MGTTVFAPAPQSTRLDHGVSVRWSDAAQDADAALRSHVAAVAGVEPVSVEVGRLCSRCGSAEHGRPWASHGVHVSLARSEPHLVTAVSTIGPVGVDVESVDDVERAWDDLSALVGQEDVPHGSGRAALWCRTEAALKRDGTGLAVPEGAGSQHLARGHVDDLVAPSGYCAAVAYDDPTGD
jgi:4'-phosphopantetheinyl transferase